MICSVIIRAYNEERHICRLLEGIARQELPEGWACEVIVVDSGSTDATVSIARHLGASIVHIPKEEFSFGRALNLGCTHAKGDILLMASAHVYPVYKDWITCMLTPFSDEQVALVYGRQTGDERTHISEQQVFSQWFPPTSNANQAHPFCNNANCAIRRSLWLMQPYDETLTGLEDLDWAGKIMQKGHRITYAADAVIVHVHEETPLQIRYRYEREAIAMKHILPQVHFTLLDFFRLFFYNTFSDCYHALGKGIFFKELVNIILFRYMQFYGTYRGHRQKGELTAALKSRFYYPASRQHTVADMPEKESKRIEYN
jgi:rhamnosyltransferase